MEVAKSLNGFFSGDKDHARSTAERERKHSSLKCEGVICWINEDDFIIYLISWSEVAPTFLLQMLYIDNPCCTIALYILAVSRALNSRDVMKGIPPVVVEVGVVPLVLLMRARHTKILSLVVTK